MTVGVMLLTNKQTDGQTNAGKNITSLADVIIIKQIQHKTTRVCLRSFVYARLNVVLIYCNNFNKSKTQPFMFDKI
jgi:hypothetical protein